MGERRAGDGAALMLHSQPSGAGDDTNAPSSAAVPTGVRIGASIAASVGTPSVPAPITIHEDSQPTMPASPA